MTYIMHELVYNTHTIEKSSVSYNLRPKKVYFTACSINLTGNIRPVTGV